MLYVRASGEIMFLKSKLQSCSCNRWANRKDSQGKAIFYGGFLGLNDIGMLRIRDRCTDRELIL